MNHTINSIPFTNSFAGLSSDFYSSVVPTPVNGNTTLVHFNNHAAELLDIDSAIQQDSTFLDVFSGKTLLPGFSPLAMLYAGHQFGHYVPQLGDGRAILLAETTNLRGQKWEIQLKGSGRTPYSRDGDGRAVLRSTIREYLCSQAMHGLGIPTTRALCIIGSDDKVYRERIETGAILTRLAPSHIRFGSFEVFYYRDQFQHLKTLADYVISHHFPHSIDTPNPYLSLLDCVVNRTAELLAQWQSVGFAHGVMNSDNMSILGLTLDYGPFGFMETYDPNYICNHSDYEGRYAFGQQPDIGLFNLSCFAQSILPLLSQTPDQAADMAKQSLGCYTRQYNKVFLRLMRRKLGFGESFEGDAQIIRNLCNLMQADKVDYTILFRALCRFSTQNENSNDSIRDLFLQRDGFDVWAQSYKSRLLSENSHDVDRFNRMQAVNPKYILRNYMAEIAIRKAEDEGDYSIIDQLMTLLSTPYDEHSNYEAYAGFPPDWAHNIAVSCSS